MKFSFHKIVVLVFAFLAFAGAAHAFDVKDVHKLVPGAELMLPLQEGDAYVTSTIKLTEVGRFKDADGSEWLRLDGSTNDGETVMAYMDILDSGVDVAVTVTQLDLEDLNTDLNSVRSMAKSRSGTLTFADQIFQFSGVGRTVFKSSSATEGKASFFIFQGADDKDLSLMILAWGDRIEVFLNERVASKEVVLK